MHSFCTHRTCITASQSSQFLVCTPFWTHNCTEIFLVDQVNLHRTIFALHFAHITALTELIYFRSIRSFLRFILHSIHYYILHYTLWCNLYCTLLCTPFRPSPLLNWICLLTDFRLRSEVHTGAVDEFLSKNSLLF